jgi:hypothetical protein
MMQIDGDDRPRRLRGGGDPDREIEENMLTDPRSLADAIENKRRTPMPPVSFTDGGIDPDRSPLFNDWN